MEKSALISASVDERPVGRATTLASLVACHTINDFYTLTIPPLMPVIQASFGLSNFQIAIIPFATQAMSALLQPTLGYLADRRRLRRALMIGGFLLYVVAMLGIGRSQSYVALILAAVLFGVAASTYHPQSATFLSHFFARNRGFAQGIHGIGNAAGFALAPIAVSFLLRFTDWHGATLYLALPGLLAALIVAVGLREPNVEGSPGLLAGITGPLVLLTIVAGLALGMNNVFVSWLPTFYHRERAIDVPTAALLLAVMSSAAVIAQPLGGKLSDRLGRRRLLQISIAGAATTLVLFLVVPVLWLAVAFSVLSGFFSSLMPPVLMVYATELAAGRRSGMAVGLVWGMGTSISALLLPLTGRMIDTLGGSVGPAYVAMAIVGAVACVLTLRLPE